MWLSEQTSISMIYVANWEQLALFISLALSLKDRELDRKEKRELFSAFKSLSENKQANKTWATLTNISSTSWAEGVFVNHKSILCVINCLWYRTRVMLSFDVAATVRVKRGTVPWDVVSEIAELEIAQKHLLVVEPGSDFTIHLRCLLCFLGVIVLDRPSGFAHLLEHEDRENVHHKVENVVK